jgi:serine/threonine protein kinase
MTPLKLTPDELKELSTLWDEAHACPPEDLAHWLAQLQVSSPAVRSALESMLSRRGEAQDSFLQKGSAPDAIDFMGSRQARQQVGTQVGNYRLMRELGRGGMGSVWLAERADGLMQRTVALKIPHPWLGARFMDRFATEREILASLVHPHIARLYEAGQTAEGQPYLVLEYVDGQSLMAYCNERALTLRQRLELFLQILDAVQFAHERHVVHRDLKPTNIIVSADGHAHLLDFGIAKLLHEQGDAGDTTHFGDAALTPNYASPEQVAGGSVDRRSDIYTLGVLLYELLTGCLPYSLDRATRASMHEALLMTSPRRPSEALATQLAGKASDVAERRGTARQLRGDVDTIVMTAMHGDAQRRFVSAKAFADDIRRHLEGQPVRCRPDSVVYRVTRFVTRYKLAVASTVAVIASLGGGMAAAIHSANEAREQARIAQEQHAIAVSQSRIASKNERTAVAVTEFMEGLFGRTQTIISDRKVAAMTVRDLIDAGAARIDTSLHDAPEAKERLLSIMGAMYEGMDMPGQAAQMYSKQLQEARAERNTDPRPVVDALLQYGAFLLNHPDQGSAAPVLKEAARLFDGVRETGPPDATRRGMLELSLAQLLYRVNPAEAERHIERSVAVFRVTKDPIDYPRALAGLSHFQTTSGHLAGAISTLQEAGRLGNPDDEGHFAAIEMLCDAQRDTGDLAAAIQECRQAYDKTLGMYGEIDGETPALARRLAKTLMTAGRSREARQVLETEVSAMRKRWSPSIKRQLGAAYVLLAEAQVRDANPVEADRWLHALAELGITDGKAPNQPFFILPDGVHANVLAMQGHLAAASATIASELAMLQERGTPGHSPYAAALLETATRIALARGDLAAAGQSLDQMRRAYVWPSDEPKHPLSSIELNARILGARVALASKKYDEAATLASEVRGLIEKQPDAVDFRLWSMPAELVLGRVDLQAGRKDSALRHVDRAVALARESGNDSLDLAEALAWQAHARRAAGLMQQAQASAAEARAIVQKQKTSSAIYLEPLGAFDHAAQAALTAGAGPTPDPRGG